MWTLVVIMVSDTPSRDDHEVQSNRTCILLPGNMRLRFNRFVYFWRGFYLYVHGDANAFVLRKINSILMRKLTSQKNFKLFFSHWLRTTWIRNWTLWAPWNWHCGALLSSRWALTSLLSGKRKKNLEKALQFMTTGKAKSIPYCAARLGFHHYNGQRPQTHFIGVFSKVGFSFERSFLAPQPVCSLCDEQTR